MKIGIYEQIINQLFEEKISSIDQNRFYIGERVIKKDEVATATAATSRATFLCRNPVVILR